jgi:predicted extracellular nuclease
MKTHIGRSTAIRTVERTALAALVLVTALVLAASPAVADSTPQTLPFSQNWTNTGLITTNDVWTAVPGIVGYLGDYTAASPTAVDPQTLLTDWTTVAIDVIANQSSTAITNGGVAEFDGIADPTVALQGSGTADAPFITLYLNTTGFTSVQVAYNLRDIDGTADNAIMPVALQYRVGSSGDFINLPAAFVADATTGPSLATLVTPVSVTLPAACDNQTLVQLRIMTTNAVGSDEWVGIDDVSITGTAGDQAPTVSSTTPTNGATGVALNASVDITFSEPVNVTGTWFTILCATSGSHTAAVTGGPTTFTLDPDIDFVNGELCTVTVLAAGVTDQDTNDPPDNMAADYVFSFTSVAVTPALSIDDVTVTEGNSGTVTATFTVSLSVPALAGGVTFDVATADGTATIADTDYVANTAVGEAIAEGNSTSAFVVTVNGDTTLEPNETFFVNVTNVTGATVADGQGVGTIANDDFTPIHDIQGPGTTSPLSGSVTTQGIVTALKSNGFFIQAPGAEVDADPNTSEGIFVFTSSAPPAAAVLGARLQVTGTISDYVPSADPLQPPLTELTGPAVVQLSTGNPLPAATAILAADTQVNNLENLERLEGMRVSVASLTVVAPTRGNLSEANATSTTNGEFYGVITGLARPFRETGIQANDPAPAGSGVTICPTGAPNCVPRFDANPERLRIESDTQTGATAIDVTTGASVTGIVGVLDYAFRTWTIYPDQSPAPVVVPGMSATGVAAATTTEFTIASWNLQRYYDTVDDPLTSDVTLTATAYANRLNKASIAIRNFMSFPDIIGVAEVENGSTLAALAAKINADAVANSQPDPLYTPWLVEGNDIGGIDVGFLVKQAIVYGSIPRVAVNALTQELDGTLFVNPDLSTEILNDRPPLVLQATIHHPNTTSFPVVVIVNHMRSLSDVASTAAGSNGWVTVGERVRAKRLAQAVDLAGLVQARQTANPAERIVLVGDFNAFEFSDGYVDSMGTIMGTPTPVGQAVLTSLDLVNPDLINLAASLTPTERYSFMFGGNAQSLDHVLINAPMVSSTVTRRLDHARISSDFNESARSDNSTAVRLSDHDPLVAYFEVATFPVEVMTFTAE